MTDHSRPELSEREQQLLALAADGLTDTAIGHRLGISEATVSTYWGRIRAKLGPFSRTELVANAIRHEAKTMVASLKSEIARLTEQLRVETGGYADASAANFYKEVLEFAPDAILIIAADGTIENANQAAAELFEYAIAEMSGNHLSMLLPERYRRVHTQHIDSYMSNPERRTMGDHTATLAKAKSGREMHVAASLSPIRHGDTTMVACIVREVARRV